LILFHSNANQLAKSYVNLLYRYVRLALAITLWQVVLMLIIASNKLSAITAILAFCLILFQSNANQLAKLNALFNGYTIEI